MKLSIQAIIKLSIIGLTVLFLILIFVLPSHPGIPDSVKNPEADENTPQFKGIEIAEIQYRDLFRVAEMFGYVSPPPTPTPRITGAPTAVPTAAPLTCNYLRYVGRVIESDGIERNMFVDQRYRTSFRLAFGETSDQGWKLLRLKSNNCFEFWHPEKKQKCETCNR